TRASPREGASPRSCGIADSVAEAPHRLDHAGRQLPAQARDEHLDGVGVALEVLRVEMLGELRARDHLALAVQQAREQAELVTGERQGIAVDRHTGAASVENQRAARDLGAGPACAAPYQGAQAREQLLHVEGLRE